MRIRFRNKDYYGVNLDEVFNKIWKSKKGTPVYSNNKTEFIERIFESLAHESSNLGELGKEYMNSEDKANREKINERLDRMEKFLQNIKKSNCLTPKHLIAYGERMNLMEIKDETKKIRDEINQTKKELPNEKDFY